jgi:hypothetical protein
MCLLAATLEAQSFFGAIVGAVTDPSEAAVPGAVVTLTNTGTGETKTAATDAAGNYQFLNLIPGFYKVEIGLQGFKRFTRDQVQVVVQAAVRVDIRLEVGDVGQAVEVNALAVSLQTESATLSQAVGGRNVTEMPLNGRNVYSLIALVPGVVMEGATPQIGGGMANQNATYVDGVPMNTAYFNQTAAAPTQDSVEEFRVQTNTASAEFGRFAGGVVSLTSKSGTNEFHGTAYEFLRNRVLNANTFFSNRSGLVRPPFTQNQYGATFGGPIRKNKTFFFGSYEGFRQRQGATFVLNVPTAKMLAGDFSELPAGVTIHDPLSSSNGTNRTPFANNIIAPNRLDPTAVILSKLYWTAPNRPGLTNNWVNNASAGMNNDTFNVRVDHNIGEKQRIFARYNLAHPYTLRVAPYNTNIYYIGSRPSFLTTAVFGDTYTFSPTMFLDVRASFLRNHNFRYPDQLGLDLTSIGWPAIYNQQDLTRTLPQICATNYDFSYGGQGGFCQGNPQSVIIVTNNVYDLAPSLTKIKGRHTMKFGVELRKAQLNYLQQNNNSGNFSFTAGMTAQNALTPGSTGYSFVSFMLGYGAINSGTNALGLNAATTGLELYQAYYFNDTFVVNRKLTWNYGVRWEGMGPFTEKWDRLAVLLPGAQNPLVGNTGTVALVNSSAYLDRGIAPHPYHLFSPRLGIAYRATDKWVIRTGGGINFLPTDGNILSSPFGSPVNTISTPWVPSVDGGLTPAATLHNPFPNGITVPPQRSANYQQSLLGLAISAPQSNNPFAYTIQYNFGVQRELPGGAVLEVAYAGLRGIHLNRFQGHQYNQLPDADLALGAQLLQVVDNPYYGKVAVGTLAQQKVAYGQLLRPYPQYTGFLNVGAPEGNSRYHALQVKFEKRSQKGGTVLVSYTRSKLISDLEQEAAFTNGVGAYIVQDYNNLRAERSLAAYDIPQTLVISYVYDLPMGKGHSLLGNLPSVADKLASGWGINGITTFQSGPPLSFTMATNNTNSLGGTPRPNVTAACGKTVSGAAQSRLNGWFNTGCFTAPPAFAFGSESRTDPNLRAAGINNFDFAVFKNTGITERFNLQFRTEIFNLFNRVQFSPPNTTLGSTTFGTVTGQANNPRLVQLALRLSF